MGLKHNDSDNFGTLLVVCLHVGDVYGDSGNRALVQVDVDLYGSELLLIR